MDLNRKTAYEVLLDVETNQSYSNLALNNFIEKNRPENPAFVRELVYGVLERRITLDSVIATHSKLRLSEIEPLTLNCLRVGAYQLLYLDRIPPSAAVNEAVRTVKMLGNAKSAGFVNAVLHAIHRSGRDIVFPPEKNKKTHLSIKYACPQWIVRLWLSAYGPAPTERLLASMLGRPPLTIRVNTIRTSVDALSERLKAEGVTARPHRFLPDALELEDTGAVEKLSAYRDGLFHVQDGASQMCARILNAQPGERVADVCAAPGGKTFTVAQYMKNTGRVDAYDLYPQRSELIDSGAARLGLEVVHAFTRDAQTGDAEPVYDRVLCDVPCSGLGIMRRKPEIRYKSRETLDNLPDLQYSILRNTSKMVKVGGTLLYSTCALNPAENRAVADRFLAENTGFAPVPIAPNMERFGDEPAHQLTLMPHLHGTDGFFVALFRRIS
ncbi:MAG: 16S rRNA (cytosine(967)-C(5))-methyltransferase RsmB [Clostridia bacterium]|nr:16S rRNA (cytosine(967)-C(5))-methyltransferase RsmB [Clostridia bacterium]